MSNEYKDWIMDGFQESKANEDLLRAARTLAICAYNLANKKNPYDLTDEISKLYLDCLTDDVKTAKETNLLNGTNVDMQHLYMVIYLQDFIRHMREASYDDSAIDEFLKPFPSDVVDALWKIQGEFQDYNKLCYAYQIVSVAQALKSKITCTDIRDIDDVIRGIGAIKECHKRLFQEEQ